MSGGLRNVRRRPSSRASCSSGLPGSVTTTNWCGRGQRLEVPVVRERLDRPAGLRGDDEERLVEVDRLLHARARRPDGSSRAPCRRSAVRDVAERAADHLGAERRAAHAEQHGVGEPVGAALARRTRRRSRRLLEHRLGDGQPAEAILDLGDARARPTATGRGARCAGRRSRLTACLTRSATGALELGRQLGGDRRRAAR